VALVRTDVSEEPGASFIRVTKIGELGTTQAAKPHGVTSQKTSFFNWILTINTLDSIFYTDTVIHFYPCQVSPLSQPHCAFSGYRCRRESTGEEVIAG
jgi:hypothetical protein